MLLVFILSAVIFELAMPLLDLIAFLPLMTIVAQLGNCKGAGPRRKVVIDALVVVLEMSTRRV